MSREAGRVRALVNAARLRHLLDAHDRVELLGYALARSEAVAVPAGGPPAPTARLDPPPERATVHLDA
jgi:hypothetical protein